MAFEKIEISFASISWRSIRGSTGTIWGKEFHNFVSGRNLLKRRKSFVSEQFSLEILGRAG
jgi:hypothetical protein